MVKVEMARYQTNINKPKLTQTDKGMTYRDKIKDPIWVPKINCTHLE